MNQQEISQIYQDLDTLEVRLEQTPELGVEYLRDRLLECRVKQNTVTELIVRVNRAYSSVRQQLRAQEAALRHAGTTEQAIRLRVEHDGMADENDSLKLLLEALSVRRGNLARTSSDIRLLEKIVNDTLTATRGGANAGRENPPKPAPTSLPSVPLPEPTANLAVESPESVEQFVQNTRIIDKAPIVEPHEIIVPPVAAAVVEPAKAATPPAPPPMVQLADDDEDIDAFLES